MTILRNLSKKRNILIIYSTSILLCVLIVSCSTIPKKTTQFQLIDAGLYRNFREEDLIDPIRKADIFYTQDTQAVMWVKLKEIQGHHTLRWEWISPDKNVYFKTGNFEINQDGKTHDVITSVHRIGIRGDRAEELPGEWNVNVYLDNYLLISRPFIIVEGIGDIDLYISKGPDKAVKKDKTRWGILIGIEKYRKASPAMYASRDAELMKEYLTKFMGVPDENIFLIIDDQATRNEIEMLMQDKLKRLVKDGDTVYLYYAGHGIPDVGNQTPYILPSDGDPDNPQMSGYPLERLYKDLSDLKAKNIYAFVDACFSGIVGRGQKETMLIAGRPGTLIVKDPVIASEKIVLFAASGENQISNFYNDEEHGLFTYYLLKGMIGDADFNRDRKVNIEELHYYVSGNVESTSRRLFGMNRYQVPVLKPNPVGGNIDPTIVFLEID